MLTEHLDDHNSVFIYYGSRSAMPARVRGFIDLTLERLAGNAQYVLSYVELKAAQAQGRKALNER